MTRPFSLALTTCLVLLMSAPLARAGVIEPTSIPLEQVVSAAQADGQKPVAHFDFVHTVMLPEEGTPTLALVDFNLSYSNGKAYRCHSRFGILGTSATGVSLQLKEGSCKPKTYVR